jgi:hypothetical protein
LRHGRNLAPARLATKKSEPGKPRRVTPFTVRAQDIKPCVVSAVPLVSAVIAGPSKIDFEWLLLDIQAQNERYKADNERYF